MQEDARRWKKMKEDERKCKNMQEHARTCKNMQEQCKKTKMNENERKWTKMNEQWTKNERKMNEQWKKMKENRVPFIIHGELEESPGRAQLFRQARSKLFQNVHYSIGNKGSRPVNTREGTARGPRGGLRGTWIWRREMSICRTEMKREERKEERERLDWGASAVSSRALIWRFWHAGGTWPTRRPPCTTLNLITTRMCTIPHGKVTTSQYTANKASSECALFPRNPGVPPQILSTREKKKEKQNEKGRNIFFKWTTKGK